jgi:hypothetical protein
MPEIPNPLPKASEFRRGKTRAAIVEYVTHPEHLGAREAGARFGINEEVMTRIVVEDGLLEWRERWIAEKNLSISMNLSLQPGHEQTEQLAKERAVRVRRAPRLRAIYDKVLLELEEAADPASRARLGKELATYRAEMDACIGLDVATAAQKTLAISAAKGEAKLAAERAEKQERSVGGAVDWDKLGTS